MKSVVSFWIDQNKGSQPFPKLFSVVDFTNLFFTLQVTMPSIAENIIANDYVSIYFKEGILMAQYQVAHIDLEIANTCVQFRLKNSPAYPIPVWIDLRHVRSVSKEARDFLATEESYRGIAVCALITPSIGTRLIARFFMHFSQPVAPTRLFGSGEKALNWLKDFHSQ